MNGSDEVVQLTIYLSLVEIMWKSSQICGFSGLSLSLSKSTTDVCMLCFVNAQFCSSCLNHHQILAFLFFFSGWNINIVTCWKSLDFFCFFFFKQMNFCNLGWSNDPYCNFAHNHLTHPKCFLMFSLKEKKERKKASEKYFAIFKRIIFSKWIIQN